MYSNHTEPVRGVLSRHLRRKIIEHETQVGVSDSALTNVVDWIPQAWQHVNAFLEKYGGSSDVTIGPRRFTDCPMKVRESQQWFTLLWNHSLVPYILEAVKKELQVKTDEIIHWNVRKNAANNREKNPLNLWWWSLKNAAWLVLDYWRPLQCVVSYRVQLYYWRPLQCAIPCRLQLYYWRPLQCAVPCRL